MLRDTSDADASTSERILAATAEVLSRNGMSKLSLSEVAVQAGVSRPTLYRWFASKGELLDAFGVFEHEMFDSGMSRATSGLRGTEKLDAALRFIVQYQQSYSGVRVVDIEPEVVIAQLGRVMPVMRARLQKLMPGPHGAVRPRRRSGSRSRTTSCAATTATNSSRSFAMPPGSSRTGDTSPIVCKAFSHDGSAD